MKETLPEHIRTAIDDVCIDAGVSLINVEVRGQAKQLILDVFIDNVDGITHDNCRAVSRGIDARLENDDYAGRLRAVEVSSPGADLPVKHLWQLRKSIGRTVRVERTNGEVLEGTLISVSDTGIEVQPEQKRKELLPLANIQVNEVKEARVVIRL